jgi:cytochrome c oxidase subunit 1
LVVFTVAVNIVFLPMHFIGMAGMPRRIPDYADGYLNWNLIMTLGTFLTIISVLIFIYNAIHLLKLNADPLIFLI